jgi:hypothetical protein
MLGEAYNLPYHHMALASPKPVRFSFKDASDAISLTSFMLTELRDKVLRVENGGSTSEDLSMVPFMFSELRDKVLRVENGGSTSEDLSMVPFMFSELRDKVFRNDIKKLSIPIAFNSVSSFAFTPIRAAAMRIAEVDIVGFDRRSLANEEPLEGCLIEAGDDEAALVACYA